MSFVFDPDVLIHALNGSLTSDATDLLLQKNRAISRITWIEVLAGASTSSYQRTRSFLEEFCRYDLTSVIAEQAVLLRRTKKWKLADAIIYATAIASGRNLVPFNSRDYPPGTPSVLIPD